MDDILNAALGGTPAPEPERSEDRDEAEPSQSRAALVKEWGDKIHAAKKRYEKSFDRMKKDIEYARKGCDPDKWDHEERYTVGLIRQHISNKTAALYAKNPRAEAKLRERLDYVLWDGSQEMLTLAQQAVQASQAAGTLPPPEALAIVQEVQQVSAQRLRLRRVGKTLEALFHYYLDEQRAKSRMKAMVRRAATCGVAYLKIGFQRELAKRPDTLGKIADITERLSVLDRLEHEKREGEWDDNAAEAERLRIMLAELEAEPEVVVREGLVFDFPRSTQIIPDPACDSLNGFSEANWLAHEFLLTANRIEEIWGVDVADSATAYRADGKAANSADSSLRGAMSPAAKGDDLYCVWEIWDKTTGTVQTVCDGFSDFLCEPEEPPVAVEGFYPIFALTLNDVEDPEDIFPPSDAYLLRGAQDEYNRSRDGIREHRRAARPRFVMPHGVLDEEDEANFAAGVPFSITKLKGVQPGTDISTVIQAFRFPGVDPNLYETGSIFADVQRCVGSPESSFGAVSASATATGQSIAEGARVSNLQANIDDLDSLLSDVARAAGQVLLREMSEEKVREIAGPGAVWPSLSMKQIAEEIFLEVRAGSSGKPNAAADLAKWERATPMLLQLPGVDPAWVVRKYIELLDPGCDISEAYVPGALSIQAMNIPQPAAPGPQPMGAGPMGAPEAQGAKGAANAPAPKEPMGGRPYPSDPQMGSRTR